MRFFRLEGEGSDAMEVIKIDEHLLTSNTRIVFDTNILLNFYQIDQHNIKYLEYYLKHILPYVWVPYQVHEEYYKKRGNKLAQIRGALEKVVKHNELLREKTMSFYKGYEDINIDVIKRIKRHSYKRLYEMVQFADAEYRNIKYVMNNYGKMHNKPMDCFHEVYKKTIFENVGVPYDNITLKSLKAEGARRYDEKIPPGYEDLRVEASDTETDYGDYIMWRQILDMASEDEVDVVFVTGEKKEDWRVKGEFCRPELILEFRRETGHSFKMLTLNELISATTTVTNIIDFIHEAKTKFNDHYAILTDYGKSFAKIDVLDIIDSKKRYEREYKVGSQKKEYEFLEMIRDLYQRACSGIYTGAIQPYRFALSMDILVSAGSLLEVMGKFIVIEIDGTLDVTFEQITKRNSHENTWKQVNQSKHDEFVPLESAMIHFF